jgi:ADP-ribose pyrophosphatase YjhB (NUDIX family)
MQKLNLVKAIVRYRPVNLTRQFVQGREDRIKGSARYLLLQKAKDDFDTANIGKWECVGGRIKKGESPLEAITREMAEELPGFKYTITKQLPTLESDKSKCDVYLIDADSMDINLSDL